MRHDARQNRERILAAAEQVFGTGGAEGSTEDVARIAGVGIATVFRHFPTKQALVEAALLRHFAELTDQARQLADAADPAQALRDLLGTLIRTGATKLTLASLAGGRDAFPANARAASQRLQDAVDAVLQRAQHAGVADPHVTVDAVYLLLRALAQAGATMPVPPATLDGAVAVVLAGVMPDAAATRHRRESRPPPPPAPARDDPGEPTVR